MGLFSRAFAYGRFCSLLLLISTSTLAAVPTSLNYQAYLTNADGSAVNGNTVITFSIYSVEFGGPPLWTDTQLVIPDQGLLSVELGNPGNPFPASLFSTPLWIGIDVDGDGEMLPRRKLTSVAFAFESDNSLSLQGQGPAAFDQSDHVIDMGNPHGVTSTQTGANTAIADLQSQLDSALITIASLQADLASVQTNLAAETTERIDADNAEAATRLAADSAHDTDISEIQANSVLGLDGILTHPDAETALFTGVNVQVINGSGLTAQTNGVGNLIVGYNTNQDLPINTCSLGDILNQAECETAGGIWAINHKSGSHNVVIGDRHNYSRHSSIVSGLNNTISGILTAVVSGFGNRATDEAASVTGGINNSATKRGASISGGSYNTASGANSSVSGGQDNIASGHTASISGGGGPTISTPGDGNEATGDFSSISGGTRNIANADGSSISGGADNVINSLADHSSILGGQNGQIVTGANYASIAGGLDNQAVGNYTHVGGGRANKAWGNFSVVAGGNTNTAGDDTITTDTASNRYTVVVGGQFNTTKAQYSVVLGGSSNTISATHGSHGGGLNSTFDTGTPPFFADDCTSRFCAEGFLITSP